MRRLAYLDNLKVLLVVGVIAVHAAITYIDQLVKGCIRWPAPRYPDPPVPPGAAYPDVPVLVLNGDLDVVTPLGDSRRAAGLFPRSTLVEVRNVGHVTALADYPGCAAGIVRRFLRTLTPGDVSCAARTPEVHAVPEFPRSVASAPAADSAGSRDHSTARDRRAAWAAGWSVGDALARWWLMSGSRGHGLRGGSFVTVGEYLAYSPIRMRLRGVRLVSDLTVHGTVVWDRRAGAVRARLRLGGAARGMLRIAWSTGSTHALASLRGRLGGRPARLTMPAP